MGVGGRARGGKGGSRELLDSSNNIGVRCDDGSGGGDEKWLGSRHNPSRVKDNTKVFG